jgi:hypothetical protein
MNKRAIKRKSAPENSILKFPTVSSMSSDSIVKGIIDDNGEFLKDKNVLLMYTTVLSAYKYAPNLESLLTQQYVCVMCTL